MLWSGGEAPFIDRPEVIKVGPMVVGLYGGRSAAGAVRNEDAAMARFNDNFEAAVVADGHHDNDASALVVRQLSEASDIHQMLATLQAADTRGLRGATTLIALVRRERQLHWLSIGDCVAFVLHADLMALGQYALNQRAFYEWFGPGGSIVSLASGIHALREGRTRIIAVTQGALRHIDLAEMARGAPFDRVEELMLRAHQERSPDNTTVVAWDVML
jgi:serine/threonine protein phosphatase PrpC